MIQQYKILPPSGRHHAFTLVELLVVVGIIAVLAAMLLTAVSHARNSAEATFCMNNLRQIGQASLIYEHDWRAMPPGNLPSTLANYNCHAELFLCPEETERADSYSNHYVARGEQDSSRYVGGCYRHDEGSSGPVLYGQCVVKHRAMAPVLLSSGDEVVPGTSVQGKTVEFADASTAKITGSDGAIIVLSFYEESRLYSVIRVPRDHLIKVDCQVTTGSAYEVVTPPAISSALGTQFSVLVKSNPSQFICELEVSEGTVGFQSRSHGAGKHKIKAGNGRALGLAKKHCPE